MSTWACFAAEGSDIGALVVGCVRTLYACLCLYLTAVLQDPNLNWATVINSFDWPDRHGVDTATLEMLIAILLNPPRNAEPHAVTGFWEIWSNLLYQLCLLDSLLSLPAFNFVQLPRHRYCDSR